MIKQKLDPEEILEKGCRKDSFTIHQFNLSKLKFTTIPRTIIITNASDKNDYIVAEGHTEVVEMMKEFREPILTEIYNNSTKQMIYCHDKTLVGMISRNMLKELPDMYNVELKYWR